MQIDRKVLFSILENIKPGIKAKEVDNSMSYFFFSGKEVITYNDQISIQHPLKTDFTLFVKADSLSKIISKSSADEVVMKENKNKLKIKIGKVQGTIATIEDEEVTARITTIAKSLKDTKWKKLPSNFDDCVQLCAFSASKSESDQTLTCLSINALDCASTDNRRISHAVFDSKMEEMLLKASEVKSLIAVKPIKYAVTKAWLHFKSDTDCIFSIRRIKGDFPNVLPLFDFDGDKVDFPKEALEGIDIASIFTDEDSPSVDVHIADNICAIRVMSDGGKVQHKSKIKYKGDPITFKINPDFLIEMMKHSTTLVISDTRIKLETEGFSLVTALFGKE